jgi:tRNA A37 threonylcarbamoyladenosine dehydratase
MTITLDNIYNRNERLWGKQAQRALFRKHVAVIGLGGVGGYIAEALARSGVGVLTLIDFDDVAETDINRQLPALLPNIGQPKVELMKQRISLINPHIEVRARQEFCTAAMMTKIAAETTNFGVDFVADAIDTLKSKVEIIDVCRKMGVPIISSLGMGNRLRPEEIYVADISEIQGTKCPFAKHIVYQLKKLGIESGLPVVVSREKPLKAAPLEITLEIKQGDDEVTKVNRRPPASSPFVPPVAGYIIAGYIVRELIKDFI